LEAAPSASPDVSCAAALTEVKPISSHSYEGKHHVAEIQVEGIMDGDGLRKLAEISGVAGHRWGAGLGGLLQMNTYRFSRKTAFDLVRQDCFFKRFSGKKHVFSWCASLSFFPRSTAADMRSALSGWWLAR
jgi:hypothetical protein